MKLSVCVINKQGRPLMPTTVRKARQLLKQGKAEKSGYRPFTIRLLIGTRGHTQPITLGVDAGYLHVGFSTVSGAKELVGGELNLLAGMSERLTKKRKYRRSKRNHLRFRATRFNNRNRSDSWLAPSIQHKLNSHVRLVGRLRSRLPITQTIIEAAKFDIQKILNPDIEGKKYQQGDQAGYANLKAYVRHRDGYQCQNPHCKNRAKDQVLQVHHIGFWKGDRTNRPSNLISLCAECHSSKNHQPSSFLFGWEPKLKSFKAETFMSSIYRRLAPLVEASTTFGYFTDSVRTNLGLQKTHHNDAFIIAGGTEQPRCQPLMLEQVRRHKRSMEQFYDAKYRDTRDGSTKTGSELASGRRTRNKNLSGKNLRMYRGHKVSKGQRRIKRLRYRFASGDFVKFERRVFEVVGMQNLGSGVKLKNYPGVKNKVVSVAKVEPFLRRGGICEVTS